MEKAKKIQTEIKKIFGDAPVNLVGGSVRDIVLGREPKDWDYSTPLLPEEIKQKVQSAGRKAYTIGERFGTIGFKVQIENTVTNDSDKPFEWVMVEVTTYRSEVYTSKSRKPEVAFISNLDEDLARRDFTINAMVLKEDGTIYDPFGGQLDILARLIKTVGTPKDRITEDPLRMLRAARFASQLDFSVDPNMIGKMRQLGPSITYVSKERWVAELDKLLVGKNVGRGLKVLMQSDLAKYTLPEVYLALGDEDAFQSLVRLFDENDWEVEEAWAALLSYIAYPYTYNEDKKGRVTFVNHEYVRHELLQGIIARLKFANKRRDILLKDKNLFKSIDL